MGILQRALSAEYGAEDDVLDDQPVSDIEINPGGTTIDRVNVAGLNYVYQDAAAGLLSQHVPGYLMQADILQAIGPVISARSDTFVIRAYGDVKDGLATGGNSITARAWCEAVVQRLPEYTDPSLQPEASPASDSINDRFGRRFRILSFRWLSSDEL